MIYTRTSTRSCTCWWYLPVNGLLGIAELIAAVVVVVVAILVVLSTRDNRNCCGRGQAWGRDGGGGIVDSLQWNTYRIRLESIYRKNEYASRVTWRFLPLFAVISARDEVGNQFGAAPKSILNRFAWIASVASGSKWNLRSIYNVNILCTCLARN